MSLTRYEENEDRNKPLTAEAKENSSEAIVTEKTSEPPSENIDEMDPHTLYKRIRAFQRELNVKWLKKKQEAQQKENAEQDSEFAELMTTLSDEISYRVSRELTDMHRRYTLANDLGISEKLREDLKAERRIMVSDVNIHFKQKTDELDRKTTVQIKGIRKAQEEKAASQKMFDIIIVVLLVLNLVVQVTERLYG